MSPSDPCAFLEELTARTLMRLGELRRARAG